MMYQEQEFLVSQSSQQQQSYSPRRIFNDHNKYLCPSRASCPELLRVVYKTEEHHFIDNTPLDLKINSSLRPIRFQTMDQSQPTQFRSEIVVHNKPETDLRIKRFRVAFRYYEDPPNMAILNDRSLHSTTAPRRNHSLHRSRTLSPQRRDNQQDSYSKRRSQSGTLSQSQTLLHQWIDDICSNERLLNNDDIVFFIKNGEFFARI